MNGDRGRGVVVAMIVAAAMVVLLFCTKKSVRHILYAGGVFGEDSYQSDENNKPSAHKYLFVNWICGHEWGSTMNIKGVLSLVLSLSLCLSFIPFYSVFCFI